MRRKEAALKAAFHFHVFHTHVHARKILNASEFLLFNIYVNKYMPEYAENYVLSTYSLSFLKERIYKDLGFYVRVGAFKKRVSGKQPLHILPKVWFRPRNKKLARNWATT